MIQADETTQNEFHKQMQFTEEEWAQTLTAVQDFVLSLLIRIQKMEAELSDLREQVNKNSRNSSRPPSSDGPGASGQGRKSTKSRRNDAANTPQGFYKRQCPGH